MERRTLKQVRCTSKLREHESVCAYFHQIIAQHTITERDCYYLVVKIVNYTTKTLHRTNKPNEKKTRKNKVMKVISVFKYEYGVNKEPYFKAVCDDGTTITARTCHCGEGCGNTEITPKVGDEYDEEGYNLLGYDEERCV